ncbi:hypothetical protein EPO05_01895 [Patescibacteria group bacterium]|nr:MAG: hypothetical protein EPO05_01895 [Patescibacteria group bacterium]
MATSNIQDIERRLASLNKDISQADKLVGQADLDVRATRETTNAHLGAESQLAKRKSELKRKLFYRSSFDQRMMQREINKAEGKLLTERATSLRDGRPELTGTLLSKREDLQKKLFAVSNDEQKHLQDQIGKIDERIERKHREVTQWAREQRRKQEVADNLRKKVSVLRESQLRLLNEHQQASKANAKDKTSADSRATVARADQKTVQTIAQAAVPVATQAAVVGTGSSGASAATFDVSSLPKRGIDFKNMPVGTPVVGESVPAKKAAAPEAATGDAEKTGSTSGVADIDQPEGAPSGAGSAARVASGAVPAEQGSVAASSRPGSGAASRAPSHPSGIAPVRTGDGLGGGGTLGHEESAGSDEAADHGRGVAGDEMGSPLERAKQRALGLGPTRRDMSSMRNKLREARKHGPQKALQEAKNMAKSFNPLKLGGLVRSINFGVDWLYWAAIAFGVFKDLLDLVLGWFPGIGTVLGFMASIAIAFLVTMAAFMEGNSMGGVQRRMARRFVILIAGTIAEMLMGLNIIPIETAVAVTIYVMALNARSKSGAGSEEVGEESAQEQSPEEQSQRRQTLASRYGSSQNSKAA